MGATHRAGDPGHAGAAVGDGALGLPDVACGRCAELERSIARRIEIEKALVRASQALMAYGAGVLDDVLGALGRAVRANRAYIFRFREGGSRMDNTNEWCSAGTSALIGRLQDLNTGDFVWFMRRLRLNEPLAVPDVNDLPADAGPERKLLVEQAIRALLIVPMFHGMELWGYMGFDDTHGPRVWPHEHEDLLRMGADMVMAHCQRSDSERQREESERKKAEVEEALRAASSRSLHPELCLCSHCKRVRDERGHWIPLEMYVQAHTRTRISSDVCPYCKKKLFPEIYRPETGC
jgi:hypothetical protein